MYSYGAIDAAVWVFDYSTKCMIILAIILERMILVGWLQLSLLTCVVGCPHYLIRFRHDRVVP